MKRHPRVSTRRLGSFGGLGHQIRFGGFEVAAQVSGSPLIGGRRAASVFVWLVTASVRKSRSWKADSPAVAVSFRRNLLLGRILEGGCTVLVPCSDAMDCPRGGSERSKKCPESTLSSIARVASAVVVSAQAIWFHFGGIGRSECREQQAFEFAFVGGGEARA